jgi:Putative quorum-sensing-regulated virulence factor
MFRRHPKPGGQMIMPFGKHSGLDVAALPKKYLKWLHGNVDLYGDLEIEVCQLLNKPMPERLSLDDKIENKIRYYEDYLSELEEEEKNMPTCEGVGM